MPLSTISRRLLLAMLLVAGVIFAGGMGLFAVGSGRWTFNESLYMAAISASTVGFSELPELDRVRGARAITVATIFTGIAAVAYFQSVLTAIIVEGVIGQAWRRRRMDQQIAKLSDHVVIAGVGSTGRHAIEELSAMQTPFVAIDRNREYLERVSEELVGGQMLFVCGDATEDHTLLAARADRARGVIAALTDDKDNLYVTLSARTLNTQARIVAKVVELEAVPKMIRAGANATVSPNTIGGRRMANEVLSPDVVEFLDQMLREKERALRFQDVPVPHDSPCVGKTLGDLGIRRASNVLVVAVRDRDRQFYYNPGPDYVLASGTVLIVLGDVGETRKLGGLLAGKETARG